MMLHRIKKFIENNKLISVLIFISFLSSLRALLLPLTGDSLTYTEIAENILFHGKYAYQGKPSTITPTLPFIIAFFYTKFNPVLGFLIIKLLNLLFIIIGLKYLYLFLNKLNLKAGIIWTIFLLTIVNNNFVLWSLPLYPEPILFCFFWMLIHFITEKIYKPRDIIFLLLPFVILTLTRYVYAVLGLMILFVVLQYVIPVIKNKGFKSLLQTCLLIIIFSIPLLFWIKYIYHLEREFDTGLSYFSRFKENDFLYNIKAGLGIIRHEEAGNVNGIPAFITLFIPMTGLRNWILSIILIITFMLGYISKWQEGHYRKLFIILLLVLSGFIFAGTGFSRYWLIMLPGFLLGFYLFFSSLKFKDRYWTLFAKMTSVIYVINELRLDIKILSNYF